MKLLSLILALQCNLLALVLALHKCPDRIKYPKSLPLCVRPKPKCICNGKSVDPLPNGDCPNSLPHCGVPIFRKPDSCKIKPDPEKVAYCNKIHFRENLNNQCKCPDGTKAWPLLLPWEVKYNHNLSNPFGRPVYTINGKTPGPTIHALKGDWVLIPIINSIEKPDETDETGKLFCPEMTTMHWHGITMRSVERQTPWGKDEQPGTPSMDGVPGVNQCPISGCGRFDYFFQFVDSGTFWYHSHYEIQIADGLSGIMIVKDCKDADRFNKLYNVRYNETEDFDDYIVNFKDWFSNSTAEAKAIKYMHAEQTSSIQSSSSKSPSYVIPQEPIPDTGLISNFSGLCKSPDHCKKFDFEKGKTYRLRLINTSLMTLFQFSIDDHEFEVVEVEGMLVERNETTMPKKFKTLNINVGQRYSILVTAEPKEEKPAHWMRLYSKGCYAAKQTSLELLAMVQYTKGAELPPPKTSAIKMKCEDPDIYALKPHCCDDDYTLFCTKPPDRTTAPYIMKIMIDTKSSYDISKIDPNDPWSQNVLGFLSPMNYTNRFNESYWTHKWDNSITRNTLLDVLKGKAIEEKNRTLNLNAYNLDSKTTQVNDIFFFNVDALEHPIHLHGHFFYVLGFGPKFSDWSIEKLNLVNPIQRDVITVPPRGWAHIRFISDNPGVWPMHCHIDWHLGIGMMAQFVELANVTYKNENKPPKEWCKLCKNVEGKYCTS